MKYALLSTVAATLFGLQSPVTPQPFVRFIPGTVAQDLAITPKGGWTYIVGSTTDVAYPVTADAFDRTCGTDGACNAFQGRFGPERRADVVLTVIDAEGTIRLFHFPWWRRSGRQPAHRDGAPTAPCGWQGTRRRQGFENGPAGCAGGLWIARFEFTLRRSSSFSVSAGPRSPTPCSTATARCGCWNYRIPGGDAKCLSTDPRRPSSTSTLRT